MLTTSYWPASSEAFSVNQPRWALPTTPMRSASIVSLMSSTSKVASGHTSLADRQKWPWPPPTSSQRVGVA